MPYISQFEPNKRKGTLSFLTAISNLLGISIEQIFDR
jgi:transcriptional regulator with XRE-family HTH domain